MTKLRDCTILNKSYPTPINCECETYRYFDTVIHPIASPDAIDVCGKGAYYKFDIKGEGIWLCSECLAHTLKFVRTPEKYNVIHFADGSLANGSVR